MLVVYVMMRVWKVREFGTDTGWRRKDVIEGTGVQVVIASVPSLAGRDTELGLKTHLLNKWLKSWCRHRSLGFFDHGAIYSAPGMTAADGSSLSQRGKRVLAEELSGLIDRCLN